MRKFLSIILLVAMLISVCSCASGYGNTAGGGNNIQKPEDETVNQPEYKDYGRGTVDFDKIEYVRPDIEAVTAAYLTPKDSVNDEDADPDSIIELIKTADNLAYEFITLTTYAEIMSMQNVTDEYWNGEYAYLSENRASLAQSAEELYIECARSFHAEYFEDKYFGEGFIEEYVDGGIFTDTLVELMRQETELENEYSTLSFETVVIKYNSMTGTYSEIMAFYEEYYGKNSYTYKAAAEECAALIDSEMSKIESALLVNLIKLRKQISNELGHKNYLTYAYESIYHDYTPEQAMEYILDIAEYVLPVYVALNNAVFSKHLNDSGCNEITATTVINDMHDLILTKDSELGDIYSYMLQHKLFDVSAASSTRYQGSFCTYLHDYEAPYLFVTATGCYSDYSTLAHEFGHFSDAYLNYGASASLDLAEVSSQGLEYITLPMLKDKLSDSDYKVLYYSQIEAALTTLIIQGFYALFEHYAYNLQYNEITENKLIECMRQAARDMGLNYTYFTSLSDIIIPHIMLYPTYVQSYCTSMSASLELFTIETKNEGEGFKIYKDLIVRDEGEMTFEEYLTECGLTSPFEKDYLKKIADDVYYGIVGSHYYKDLKNKSVA